MADRRTFTIGDLMVLIVAVALGLALDRWRATEMASPPPGASGIGIGASDWLHVLSFGAPSCFVAALALALIPMRWMRPRPSRARIARQPGAVACAAIVATIVANAILLGLGGAITAATRSPDAPLRLFSNWYYWEKAVHLVPMGVGGAWAALALGGRWSTERSWIDRAGVALGLYWVGVYLLGFFSEILSRLLPYS